MIDQNSPSAWLQDLGLHANAEMAYINGRFREKSASRFNKDHIVEFVDRLLPFAARALEIFIGSPPGFATCGRVIPDVHPSFNAYEFDIPVMGLQFEMPEWNSVEVEIWIRSHVVRTVDYGFLTLAIRTARIAVGDEWKFAELLVGGNIVHRLNTLRDPLSKPLGRIVAHCINESEGEIIFDEVCFDEHVFEDIEGYELRGILR